MKLVNDISRKMRTSMNTLNGMVTIARERIARGGDAEVTLKNVSSSLDMIAEEAARMIGLLDDFSQIDSEKTEAIRTENLVAGRFAERRFLVVDDVPGNAMVVAEMLSLCGGVVVTASNGKSAVDAFSKSEPGSFDCVLMDIRMPTMDGFEATQAIRAMNRDDAKKVPIIAMSADTFVEDLNRSVEVGMNACVTKPVRLHELSSVIEKALSQVG